VTAPRLSYTVRRSPYFARTLALGARDFMVYNHMYMPLDYGRDPRADYDALVERVTLWDVGAERQTELRGPGALALADHLCPRDLSRLEPGRCLFTPVCDDEGQIMADCIVLRVAEDVVWISHSDVDLELWAAGIARARGGAVAVSEADVAPLQLQGPAAAAVLGPLCPEGVAALPRFRCATTTVAGVDAVVSATGWSREPGFEIYPLGSERAVEIWDALCAAGEPHGLLVTGPNVVRAVEQGITDTQYRMNCGMNPIEAGIGHMLDLDGADFVGRDALLAVRREGARRRTVGLVCEGPPFPWLEDFWPVTAGGRDAGVARWAVWSYALGCNIAIALLQTAAGEHDLVVHAPDGPRAATPHPIPFVSG
jgi:aminomethyltransferase